MKRLVRPGKILITTIAALVLACLVVPVSAASADNGIPVGYKIPEFNGIPAQQFKDVFESRTLTVSGIEVTCDGGFSDPFHDAVHFRVFNSTTQETEYEVDTINSGASQELPPLALKKNHNYIFFVEDPQYMLGTKKYVQILDAGAEMANAGAGAYDYKHVVINSEGKEQYNTEYKKLTSINVHKRGETSSNPREDSRLCIGCTAVPAVVTYKGKPVQEKLRFRFVSEVEERKGSTNYLTEGQGILYANLLEDITYMVYLDDKRFYMDPFPIVVKDKSEYKEGRYAYNHTTCERVDEENPVRLYDSAAEAHSDPDVPDAVLSATSLKKRVTVTGMNFRRLLILDRGLDKNSVRGLDGTDHEVFDITAVNPHRWEISKIKGTDFTVTKKIPHDKLVTHVYYAECNGSYTGDTDASGAGPLNEIGFTQKSPDEVSFTIDGLSLYRLAVVYDSSKTYSQKQAEDKAAREEAARKAKEAAWKGITDKKLPVPKVSRPKVAKKGMTVKWKKLSSKQLKKAGGIKIEVQYSLNKKFPMEKTGSKFAGKKKTSVKIKGLKSKKTYYVRVRTYRGSGSTKHVSRWSKVRKVKVK